MKSITTLLESIDITKQKIRDSPLRTILLRPVRYCQRRH